MDQRSRAYLNWIETEVPSTDVHERFLHSIAKDHSDGSEHISPVPNWLPDERERRMFFKLVARSQIEHRYSVLTSSNPDPRSGIFDQQEVYRESGFSSTAKRMAAYKAAALPLARGPVSRLLTRTPALSITHLIVTSCTGFYAPGLDIELQKHFQMRSDLERTVIGFMGCYAAFNAMKLASSIVQSRPAAKVLIVNLELCTLHLHEEANLEDVLGFMQFGDGCAATIVSKEEFGLRLDEFQSFLLPEGDDQIQWDIGDQGFVMKLSPTLPQTIGRQLPSLEKQLFANVSRSDVQLWAVHPGGRSILDVVADKLCLLPEQMFPSKETLRRYGNMSSATIMFVLKELLQNQDAKGNGVALGFGPGLTVESMFFHKDLY